MQAAVVRLYKKGKQSPNQEDRILLHSPSILQPKKLMTGFSSFSPIYNLNN